MICQRSKQESFTLIELLVVIVIIGILAGVIMISTSSSIDKANFAKAQAFSSTVQNELLSNLVSEWTFDEGPTDVGNPATDNDVKDSWGINNGIIGGNPQVLAEDKCVHGKCLFFDGAGDYINLGNNIVSIFDNGKIFTYSVWFNPQVTLTTAWQWIFCKAYTSHISPHYQVELRLRPNNVLASYIYNSSGSGYLSGLGGNVTPKQWNHAVVVIDLSKNIHTVYINGNFKGKSSTPSGTYVNWNSDLAIAANDNIATSTTYDFYGYIDDVRIYNSALSSSQIKQTYIAGLDSMLSTQTISKEEYNRRINILAYEK